MPGNGFNWSKMINIVLVLGLLLLLGGGFLLVQEEEPGQTTDFILALFNDGAENGAVEEDDETAGLDEETEETEHEEEVDLTREEIISSKGRYPAKIADNYKEKFSFNYNPISSDQEIVEQIEVEIPSNVHSLRVAEILADEGLVDYDEMVRLMVMFELETVMRAGTYEFPADVDLPTLLDEITID